MSDTPGTGDGRHRDDETRRVNQPHDAADLDATRPIPSASSSGDNGRPRLGDRYELLGSLGQGGMADVQRARDLQLDREVAIKILHARYANDPEFLRRFQREARAAANLNHPSIVGVYDAGESDHRPYIVMELVEGRSLKDVLRHERLSPDAALQIISDAATALHYAHERGLIHRDVKPANIMLSDSGTVKVTDFGIARAVGAETVTQTAAVFGTAAYMAPEQARSDPVDRRTDVYALGCVLYELLADRPPFTADSPVALAHKHISEMPPPPSTFADNVSGDLDAITLKAMAKDPADRYQTARDLSTDLGRARTGQAVTAPVAAAWAAPPQTIGPPPEPTLVTGAAPEYDYDYSEEEAPRGSRWWAYTLLALAVIAAVVLIGWFLSTLVMETEPELVAVPNVVNQPLEEARRLLEAQGLDSDVAGRETSLEVPLDAVISTDPPVGDQVEIGTEVGLIISDGKPTTTVPELEGRPEEEARSVLQEAQLSVGDRTTETSDDVPEGSVIRSNPSSGTEVDVDSLVDLVISSGTGAIPMPDVREFPESRAIEELETACDTEEPPCLRVTVSRQYDPEIQEGIVIEQNPEPDTQVQPGSGVVIVVSRGPEPVPTTEPPPPPAPTEPEPEPPEETEEPSPSPEPTV